MPMYDRTHLDPQHCYSPSTNPPWRNTEIPVELFDLITAPPSTSVRLYRLHYEILQFYHFMIPTKEENKVRKQVIDRICAVIHQYLPNTAVDIYGSHKTCLNLPMSDIDLIVYSIDGRQWVGDELVEVMSDLRDAFCRHKICTPEEIQVLNLATVPIIKLTDRGTDVKVDMSFNMNGGPRSTQLTLSYLQTYPYLKYLVYVLKQYIYQLDLNKVWTGGISSYSLILMLVCFFQCYYKKDQQSSSSISLSKTNSHSQATTAVPSADEGVSSISCPSSSAASCISSDDHINCSNPSSDNDDDHHHQLNFGQNYHPNNVSSDHVNLGQMLIDFLHLYAFRFDYAKFGIRVHKPFASDSSSPAGFINKEELFKNFSCGHRTMTNLCIVDPFDEKNDIGKATWLIGKLQVVFRGAFETLTQNIFNQKPPCENAPPILSKILTIDDRILAYRQNLHQLAKAYEAHQLNETRQYHRPIFADKSFMDYSNEMAMRYGVHIPWHPAFIHSLQTNNEVFSSHQTIDNHHRNIQS